jgi:hypothetical protein
LFLFRTKFMNFFVNFSLAFANFLEFVLTKWNELSS